jgi:hypothetical protein
MDQNLSINKFTAAIKLTLSDKTSISDSDLKKEIEVIKQKNNIRRGRDYKNRIQ